MGIGKKKKDREFKVGDKVRVLNNEHGGEFDIGTVGIINAYNDIFDFRVDANNDYWYYAGDGDIELVEPAKSYTSELRGRVYRYLGLQCKKDVEKFIKSVVRLNEKQRKGA